MFVNLVLGAVIKNVFTQIFKYFYHFSSFKCILKNMQNKLVKLKKKEIFYIKMAGNPFAASSSSSSSAPLENAYYTGEEEFTEPSYWTRLVQPNKFRFSFFDKN